MRLTLITGMLAAVLLVACQMGGPDRAPMATDEITVTPLDAPDGTAAATGTIQPKLRPDTVTEPANPAEPAVEPATSEPATSEPDAPPSPDQVLCEKGGGQWAVAGATGAYVCVSPTRDGGKMCRKKTDCEGLCLARSGTCAPFTPLYGCNDVLEKDGRRVTLCID